MPGNNDNFLWCEAANAMHIFAYMIYFSCKGYFTSKKLYFIGCYSPYKHNWTRSPFFLCSRLRSPPRLHSCSLFSKILCSLYKHRNQKCKEQAILKTNWCPSAFSMFFSQYISQICRDSPIQFFDELLRWKNDDSLNLFFENNAHLIANAKWTQMNECVHRIYAFIS